MNWLRHELRPVAHELRRGGCPHPPAVRASRADIESAPTHAFSMPHAAILPQNHSPPPILAGLRNNNYLQPLRAGAEARPYEFLSVDRRRGGFHIRPPRGDAHGHLSTLHKQTRPFLWILCVDTGCRRCYNATKNTKESGAPLTASRQPLTETSFL